MRSRTDFSTDIPFPRRAFPLPKGPRRALPSRGNHIRSTNPRQWRRGVGGCRLGGRKERRARGTTEALARPFHSRRGFAELRPPRNMQEMPRKGKVNVLACVRRSRLTSSLRTYRPHGRSSRKRPQIPAPARQIGSVVSRERPGAGALPSFWVSAN